MTSLKCLKHKQVRIHPEINVKMIHFQAKHGIEALPKLMGTHQHCDQRSETRNDNGHPGTGRRRPEWSEWAGGRWFFAVGPKRLWKTGFAPQRGFSFKFQRMFDIFAHYIGFQEGISIRQKELVWIVQINTNTAATNTIFFWEVLQAQPLEHRLQSLTTKINESNVSQVWETNKLPAPTHAQGYTSWISANWVDTICRTNDEKK